MDSLVKLNDNLYCTCDAVQAHAQTHTHSSMDEFMVKFNPIWHSKTYLSMCNRTSWKSECSLETSNQRTVCAQLRAKRMIFSGSRNACSRLEMYGETPNMISRNEGITVRRLHLSNQTFYLIIVISLSPFSSRMPRNSSSFCWNAGLKVGTVITGLHLLHLQPPPEERKEQLKHPFRRLSCLQALIQVSGLSGVLGFCHRLGSLMSMMSRSRQSYYYSSQLPIFLQPAISWINGTELSPSEQMSWSLVVFVMSCELFPPHRGTCKACQISAWVLLLLDGRGFFYILSMNKLKYWQNTFMLQVARSAVWSTPLTTRLPAAPKEGSLTNKQNLSPASTSSPP